MSRITLFRPVGLPELKLILETGNREYPSKPEDGNDFFAVFQSSDAALTARELHAQASHSGYCGFLTTFECRDLNAVYPDNILLRNEGSGIPRKNLDQLFSSITEPIRVKDAWYGPKFRPEPLSLPGNSLDTPQGQVESLIDLTADGKSQSKSILARNKVPIVVNAAWWIRNGVADAGKVSDLAIALSEIYPWITVPV